MRPAADRTRHVVRGIGAVPAQAKDEAARRFWLAQAEFAEWPGKGRALFLPEEAVLAGFGMLRV